MWRRFLYITLIVGLVFVKSYLGIIALGVLMAFMFFPVQKYFEKKYSSKGKAAALTTIISILTIGIPATVILFIAVDQTITLIESLGLGTLTTSNTDINNGLVQLTIDINNFINANFGISGALSVEELNSFLESTLPEIIKSVSASIVGIVSGIPSFFTNLITYLFVFVAVLMNGEKLLHTTKSLSPFDNNITSRYTSRMGAMAKAMIKGQFLIAVLQGLATAIALSIIGFSQYFAFFFLIFTFMSFIPLGAGIIIIPLGILLILTGDVKSGVILLANHFIIVTNIDNYVRPKVVPKEAQLNAALTIIGAFAGVTYFGFLGVIYGPVIMIIITTTIESYIEQKNLN